MADDEKWGTKKKSCVHSNSMNNRKVGWNWKKAGRKLYIKSNHAYRMPSIWRISFAHIDFQLLCIRRRLFCLLYFFNLHLERRKWIATFEWRKHTHNFCKVKEKLKRNLSFIWFSQCSNFQEFARGNSHQNFRCFGWDALPTRRLHCKLFCACKSKCSINWNEN